MSPAFDFSQFAEQPIISFYVFFKNDWQDSDVGFNLQTSFDGIEWHAVGSYGEYFFMF